MPTYKKSLGSHTKFVLKTKTSWQNGINQKTNLITREMARNRIAKSQIGILKRNDKSRGINNPRICLEGNKLVSLKIFKIKRGDFNEIKYYS